MESTFWVKETIRSIWNIFHVWYQRDWKWQWPRINRVLIIYFCNCWEFVVSVGFGRIESFILRGLVTCVTVTYDLGLGVERLVVWLLWGHGVTLCLLLMLRVDVHSSSAWCLNNRRLVHDIQRQKLESTFWV